MTQINIWQGFCDSPSRHWVITPTLHDNLTRRCWPPPFYSNWLHDCLSQAEYTKCAMQPTFPASKPLSRVFMQAIDAPLPDDAREAAADAALPVADPPAPAVQPIGQNTRMPGLASKISTQIV